MQVRKEPYKRGDAQDWTRERIGQLDKQGIEHLRDNAERHGESELAVLCSEVLKERPKAVGKKGTAAAAKVKKGRHLTSRTKAFEARGVFLTDARTSWGGVRKSDDMVVMTLWADAIQSGNGVCHYLLWAPNTDGKHPWSDTLPGRERLEHCRLLKDGTDAEGLLVYGERLDGHLPEHKARSVHGVDAETVVRFKVEKRGDEYWAVWGRKTA